MKLLIFSPYYPPHIGGLETHSDEFNKHLSKRGLAITVFTPQLPKHAPSHEIRYDNVVVLRFPAIEIIHNYPIPQFWKYSFWKVLKKACQSSPDLIISRTRFFSTSLIALVYSKLTKTPWIHIEHGSDFAQFNGRFKTALGKYYDYTFGKLVLKMSDKNIANSVASSLFVKHLSQRNDCEVIYRGVEIQTILSVPADTVLKEQYSGRTIIGFIGRLIDGKGVIDLLRALALLKQENIVCFIVGDGPERPALEKFSREHNLQEKIIFFGNRPFKETIGILKAFDIFVNPSYTEGIPTAVIEAALCQKAIIATNVGGTPEIIENPECIFLVPPKKSALIAEKIDKLITDPLLRDTLGKQAFFEVKEKFSWDNAASRYLIAFENLMNSKH